MQVGVAGQLPVGHLAPVGRGNDTVGDGEPGSVDPEALGGEVDEDRPHFCTRKAQRHAAVLDRLAAGGDAFVGSFLGVSGNHVQARQRQVELLGGDLRQRGDDALAELDLAGAHRCAAVGRDANPGVEHAVAIKAARQGGRLLSSRKLRRQREGDDDAAEAGGKIPPRDVRVHQILPVA